MPGRRKIRTARPMVSPRPDVHNEFPLYPNGEKSGFRSGILTNSIKVPDAPGTLYVLTGEHYRRRNGTVSRSISILMISRRSSSPARTRLAGGADAALARLISPIRGPRDALPPIARCARRELTLRLDIINKCNLRCVMCHFSDDAIFKRPTSQLTGEQFKALFDGIGAYGRPGDAFVR